MGPAFGFAQAVRLAVPLGSLKTGEALCRVKVEMLLRDHPPEPEKVLDASHLTCGVANQALAANKQQLLHGEVQEPALEVLGVHADLNGAPRGVDQTRRHVLKGQALEGRDVRLLGASLGVVGDGPRDGIPDHYDELCVFRHGVDSSRDLLGDVVAGGLLHRQLAL